MVESLGGQGAEVPIERPTALTIAVVGGSLRAASILRLLNEIENVNVAAIACSTQTAPAVR